MSIHLKELAASKKSIPLFPDWDEEGNSLSWISPLDMDGVTVEGLQIRMTAHLLLPDEAVVAQPEFRPPAVRSQQLIRVEWKPLRPHNNKNRGPSEWRLKQFRCTHEHRFEDNWHEPDNRMLAGNLPIAVPIQDVDSYKKFLDICCKSLNVENMSLVPLPPWRPRML